MALRMHSVLHGSRRGMQRMTINANIRNKHPRRHRLAPICGPGPQGAKNALSPSVTTNRKSKGQRATSTYLWSAFGNRHEIGLDRAPGEISECVPVHSSGRMSFVGGHCLQPAEPKPRSHPPRHGLHPSHSYQSAPHTMRQAAPSCSSFTRFACQVKDAHWKRNAALRGQQQVDCETYSTHFASSPGWGAEA